MIDRCCACRHLPKFCIKILLNRWDEIRFIIFFDALKIIKDNKDFFKNADILQHWRENTETVKDIIREYHLKKNAFDLVNDENYIFLFENVINQYNIIQETVRQLVVNKNPLFFE